MKIKTKKAQIWVETAIYTLIGLSIIGIILAIATPAINNKKDEAIIEQTITALNALDKKMLETRETTSNIRNIEFRVKRGKLVINSTENNIMYILEESKLEYSEPGVEVEYGKIIILTEKIGKKYNINLILPYENLNIIYKGEEKEKTLNPAATPYKLSLENKGQDDNEKIIIDINEFS